MAAEEKEEPPSDLSEEEYAKWLRPNEAIAKLMERNGWDREQCIRTLLTRLAGEVAHAAAETVVWNPTGKPPERRQYRFIPAYHWNPESTWVPEADLWETGDIYFDVTSGAGYSAQIAGRISYFGVRFGPVGVSKLYLTQPPKEAIHAPLVQAAPLAEPKNRGGRPPNDYWEPLLIEMARQLYEGELQPKRQADIENAMHDWLVAKPKCANEPEVSGRQ